MSSFYNLDGIKTELRKMLSEKEALWEAWKNVTFPTKKDGTPFAAMNRNFDGATYKPNEYCLQSGEYVLRVVTWAGCSRYVTDEIKCYELVRYLKDETMLSKTENYIPKQSYLEQVYKYDLEDIKTAVNARISYLEDRVYCLRCELDIVERCYNDFRAGYEKLLKELENNCIEAGTIGFAGDKNDIYYMIRDTIQTRFPYA